MSETLIIDDNNNDRFLFARYIKTGKSIQVTCAPNGDEGLTFLRGHPQTNLVIVDQQMPGKMQGHEFTQALLDDDDLKNPERTLVWHSSAIEHIMGEMTATLVELIGKTIDNKHIKRLLLMQKPQDSDGGKVWGDFIRELPNIPLDNRILTCEVESGNQRKELVFAGSNGYWQKAKKELRAKAREIIETGYNHSPGPDDI